MYSQRQREQHGVEGVLMLGVGVGVGVARLDSRLVCDDSVLPHCSGCVASRAEAVV